MHGYELAWVGVIDVLLVLQLQPDADIGFMAMSSIGATPQ
jgi:hypothetical protein